MPFPLINIYNFLFVFSVYQFVKRNEILRPESVLTFVLFFFLYIFSGMPFWHVFKMFMFIQFIGSLHCVGVALNVGHHDPELFHDGDAAR